jgi:hypothetical protein
VPFSEVKKAVDAEIRAQIPSSLCYGGSLPSIAGSCIPLNFYDAPGITDVFFAFGGMQSGRYILSSPTISRSEDSVTVTGTVNYYFGDIYEFDESDAGKSWCDRFGRNLLLAGWASSFRTGLTIQDKFICTLSCPKVPDNPGNNQGSGTTNVQTSISPEDKWGPAGYDAPETPAGSEAHFILPGETFDYRIEMWNKPEAPVPTQDAVIYDYLDPNVFDLSTFEFTRVGFLKWDVPLPGGQAVDVRVDCRPDMNLAVEIKGTFDPETGRIEWWFHSIDPMTGDYPEDPNTGFLPPYNLQTGFEIGWMEFRVKVKDSLPTGTQIANQAFVQFDFLGPWGPAPKEGPWINTIDCEAPSSQVNPLPAEVTDPYIVVSWNGNDGVSGSGIANYDVYVSDNGSPFVPWLKHSALTEKTFVGVPGHTYCFYSVARDNVGNIEEAPIEPDASVTLSGEEPNQPPVADAGPDQTVERTSYDGAEVTLDGSNSYDPDDKPLPITYEWSWTGGSATGVAPTVVLPMGTTTVTLLVDDGELTDTDTVEITVQDTTPPDVQLLVPQPNEALQDTVNLTAEAMDISGVNELYFYIREPGGAEGSNIGYENLPAEFNESTGKWECPFNTLALDDGYYVILARAIDPYGNVGWAEYEGSKTTPFSIRNWAVIELLPTSKSNKAGRTMSVKFSLRIDPDIDPDQPFVRYEELRIEIYDGANNPSQTSTFGDTARDYRIDSFGELYITNFKTGTKPAQYTVEIWRIANDFLIDTFTFETVK